MPSDRTGPFQSWRVYGPSFQTRLMGGWKLLGDRPCLGRLLWNVGHSALAGAVGGFVGVTNE